MTRRLAEDDPPRRPSFRGAIRWAVLVFATIVSVVGRRMPTAVSADAPLVEFSAGRAHRVLGRIARASHPVGSAEHEVVLAALLDELRTMGVVAETQRGVVRGVALTNVLVSIRGSAPTGTVLGLAHYDSVPRGPGAADDGAGVVTWLEVLRTLRARNRQPRNDVIICFTDGEERRLLGAELFVQQYPEVARIRTIVNLEAIGNGGPAVLFQLGPENGARVREFARVVPAPAGFSLGDAVFRHMPNDTDLSVFLRRGITGFNLALTAGTGAYHAAHDTPANIDPRSLQHMGDSALALLDRTSQLDLAAAPLADETFFDVLGWAVIHWPRSWDFGFALLGLALVVLAVRRIRTGRRMLVPDLGRHAARVAVEMGLLCAAWWLLDQAVALAAPKQDWVAGNTTSGGLLFVGIVGVGFARALWREGSDDGGGDRRALAAMIWWSIATVAAVIWLPGGSFVVCWPLILAAGSCAIGRGRPGWAIIASVAPCLALVLGLPILHLMLQLAQRVPIVAVAATVPIVLSATDLFSLSLRPMAALGRPWRVALLSVGILSIVASVIVARVLGWRCGAWLP